MSTPIEISFAIDSRGLIPLVATSTSVLRHLSRNVAANIYIFQIGLQPSELRKLTRILKQNGAAQVHIVDMSDAHLAMFEQVNHIPPVSYARLLFPDLLPHLDRLIYLDSDLLVTTDVSELWNIELQDNRVGAVRDASFDHADQAGCLEYCREELENPTLPPFNAGVLLIDLSKWRVDEVYKKSIAFAARYRGRMKNADQDILNVLFSQSWKALDPKWNVPQFLLAGSKSKLIPPPDFAHLAGRPFELDRIYHMWGKHKPWNSGPKHVGRSRWLGEVRLSGWFSAAEWVSFKMRDQLRSYLFSVRTRYHPCADPAAVI